MPIAQGATVPHITFCQFYHVYVHEITNNKVANKQQFLSKLSTRLKRPPSGEVHWQNAHRRFELVRPHLRKLPPQAYAKTSSDDTSLPSQVVNYAALTLMVFSANPTTSELLFDDAYFYWSILKAKAGDDFEKRKALLEVPAMMRNMGIQLMYTNEKNDFCWVKYYPDNSFLRNMLKLNKADTHEVKFLSGNIVYEEAFGVVLRNTHNPSDILQTRLRMFGVYRKGILHLTEYSSNEVSGLDLSEMQSQLGPLQDYFPKFMRERSLNLSRSFLVITLSRRYLQKMEQFKYFPSILLENAAASFSHFCNIYLTLWQSFPVSQVSTIFSRKLIAYMNKKINIAENAIYGCTAESFDFAVKKFGISGIALFQTPHSGDAASLEIVEQKEFRLLLEAVAYRNFYRVRFHNKQEDLSMLFSEASNRPQEDQEYAALVMSWIRAKTYPNLRLPFIISKDQNDKVIASHQYAMDKGVYMLEEDALWKELRLNHVLQKLELEMLVYDLSDDPVWKQLQLDYIHRLDSFVEQMPR